MNDSTFRRPIAWTSSARTDVGLVREVNEDSVIARPDAGVWAVADGMGGHHFGDLASNAIVTALDAIEPRESLSDYVDAVEDSLLGVNQQLLEEAAQKLETGTMGSTLVALVIKDRVGACLWVGDSRLYRFRNQELVQLSRDHSQLEEMIELGLISREEAENHPDRNIITRAIGVESPLFVDVHVFTTQVGDTFLLCSDGLYGAVSRDDIIATLEQRDVEKSTADLVEKTLANGAPDNVSVIVVQGNPGRVAPSQSEQA
ncbi:PP2C family protein-serine/threonine phosphatase [Gilvimarinus sp. F26214L]|uniref:PP2C family protein-serine/threonine phosphatase n=1 Tax=Gilvimarinus sp. DZF01 TaxID=3461371 RepID=UPI0040461527